MLDFIDQQLKMDNTGILIITCAITLCIWEAVAFVKGKKRALISTWWQKFGFRAPSSIFMLGMLAGHFWMYYPPTLDDTRCECPKCEAKLVLSTDENDEIKIEVAE